MDRNFHEKESKKFRNSDDAYIHFEMKKGHAELFVNGSLIAVLYAVNLMIARISKMSGKSFDQVLMDIQYWHYSTTDESTVIEKGEKTHE